MPDMVIIGDIYIINTKGPLQQANTLSLLYNIITVIIYYFINFHIMTSMLVFYSVFSHHVLNALDSQSLPQVRRMIYIGASSNHVFLSLPVRCLPSTMISIHFIT